MAISYEEILRANLARALRVTRCQRKAVGCSIWDFNIEDGAASWCSTYNGPAKGLDCLGGEHIAGCGCMHAEIKALLLIRELCRLDELHDQANMTMFCTYSPCFNCANAIIYSPFISTVVFGIETEYDKEGIAIAMLEKSGRTVKHVEI